MTDTTTRRQRLAMQAIKRLRDIRIDDDTTVNLDPFQMYWNGVRDVQDIAQGVFYEYTDRQARGEPITVRDMWMDFLKRLESMKEFVERKDLPLQRWLIEGDPPFVPKFPFQDDAPPKS